MVAALHSQVESLTTSDGVIVAFHDNDFSRVVVGIDEAMKKRGVKDITFAELENSTSAKAAASRTTDIYVLMRGKPEDAAVSRHQELRP